VTIYEQCTVSSGIEKATEALVLEVKLFNLQVITTDQKYVAKNVTGHNPH